MIISKINFIKMKSKIHEIQIIKNIKMSKNIMILTLSVLVFLSCGKDAKEVTNSDTPIKVQVNGTASNNSEFITASGKTEAESSANLSTRMMGYVTKVHVKTGQKVSAGQLLVSINSTDLQAKKAQVDSSILQATAAYNNAKKDYDRFVNLFAQQSASQKELDDMTSRYEMAKATLAGAKQMRNEVMAQFSYSNITAPFSGEITNTFIKEGDMANPGMPLVSVEGASRMQVTAMVSESDISQIKNGMPVKIMVKSLNKEVAGKVSEVSGSAKNTGGQFLVKVTLKSNDKSILSGMFVNVQFPIANQPKSETTIKSDKVMVPESALVNHGQLTGIYTIANGKTAILRWIRTGKTFGNQVEVLSGLTVNEQYIVSAEGKLYNGANISVQ
jgi:RND family efflux transporter MFP subunit